MRVFLCLFGVDTRGIVLYLVDSQNVVLIRISEANTITNSVVSGLAQNRCTILAITDKVLTSIKNVEYY